MHISSFCDVNKEKMKLKIYIMLFSFYDHFLFMILTISYFDSIFYVFKFL